jgi:hypothetical protein
MVASPKAAKASSAVTAAIAVAGVFALNFTNGYPLMHLIHFI